MSITVWKNGTWKYWDNLSAIHAQDDPDWLVTIPLQKWDDKHWFVSLGSREQRPVK